MIGFSDCLKKDVIDSDGEKVGEYIIVNPNFYKGFNFGYVVFIPQGITSNTTLIVEGANTCSSSGTIQSANADILKAALDGSLPIYSIAFKCICQS